MSDYISREAAIDALDKERKYLIARGQLGAEHVLVHHACNIIDELPAANVRPVVLCKDCERNGKCDIQDIMWGMRDERGDSWYMGDAYCAEGVKRQDDAD